jgi:hypothetical protein
VADSVGKHDEIARGVEKLSGPKKFTGELRQEELLPRAAGAVKDKHGIGDAVLRVARELAERGVMQSIWQCFSRPKFEIFDYEITLRCFEGAHLSKIIQSENIK